MAKRLIDGDKLKRQMIAFATGTNANYLVIENIVMMINQADTVDAVEVCYCKDCKFWEKQKDSAQGCCLLSGNYPTGGWYCADGKRRDEGG